VPSTGTDLQRCRRRRRCLCPLPAGALLPLAYLALLIDYGATFFLRTRTHARTPHLLLVVALHLGYLVACGLHLGYPPITNTPEILSVLALAMTAVYAWVELASRDRRSSSCCWRSCSSTPPRS